MKIHFVNHASYIIETGPIRLICDPWIEGPVFNDGWDLLTPTKFRYEDFRDITHIWFSHEHPDHFNPPNVKKIPEEYRREITVLFQHTNDKKVLKHCERLGFQEVRELPLGSWVDLVPGIEVRCCPVSVEFEADSWLCLRTPEVTLLNLNDCGIDSSEYAAEVRQQVGRVDVLTTQYSYASWQGNADEKQRRRVRAAQVLAAVHHQIEALKPRWVIPFASFVWFCHEENHFMNDEVNRVGDVAKEIETKTSSTPVVMYPGDSWEVGAAFDSATAIARYAEDLRTVLERDGRVLLTNETVPFESLQKLAQTFAQSCVQETGERLARFYMAVWNLEYSLQASKMLGVKDALLAPWRVLLGGMEPTYVYVSDHRQSYSFSLSDGLRPADRAREYCDAVLSSNSLALCFRLPWGGETLRINGRFEAPPKGREYVFFNYFLFARTLNLGVPLGWKRAARAVAHRMPLLGRLVAGNA
jgi:L-ascorbate metabolism protein UlaG (beta-lactamase superfamily)